MRWIPLLVLACLWAVASALSVRVVTAQGPPTRFYGKVTVTGTTPPAGTAILRASRLNDGSPFCETAY